MLDLEACVLSKSALKPQAAPHEQPPPHASDANSASTQVRDSSPPAASAESAVFFRVFEVAEGGPAQAAGLIDGDTVRHPSQPLLLLLLSPSLPVPLLPNFAS